MRTMDHRAHPWHGVPLGLRSDEGRARVVTAYIEIVPTDTVKYELDKQSGILKIDRPQKYSNVVPTLYGFLPQTYCAEDVGARCAERNSRPGIVGDGDPLDVCVLTERAIAHGDILVAAIPIGGLRMIDGNQADDKIIAVLAGDAVYGDFANLGECPPNVVDRLRHYFLTYKRSPDGSPQPVEIAEIYDAAEAVEVIRCSQRDYWRHYPPEGA